MSLLIFLTRKCKCGTITSAVKELLVLYVMNIDMCMNDCMYINIKINVGEDQRACGRFRCALRRIDEVNILSIVLGRRG